jgi:hypothetical protein
LRAAVLSLALYSFAENTVDPDLWGHVLFGQRIISLGTVERIEPFSWTAVGAPWINHEVLAEMALGAAHALAGPRGLMLLKLALGMLTFVIALRLGCRRLPTDERTVAWVVAALSVVEIAFGFACRPQIFTALGFSVLLWVITRVTEGSTRVAWALPLIFLLWFNTHGGAVAGFAILVAVVITLAVKKLSARERIGRAALMLALAAGASALAAFCNPWGTTAVIWLVRSVSWQRPTIEEWNPTPIGWDHAPLFLLILLAVFALLAAPRNRRGAWWTWVVLALLAVAAVRSVRHTPLFAIAALAFLPGPLLGALSRWKTRTASLLAATRSRGVQIVGAAALLAATGAMLSALGWRRDRAFTMEVPRDQYPVAAVEFIRQNAIEGDLLTWFDWGEMCLWELPNCRVSIDGRLDTCYPMPVIEAHWRFFAGGQETGPELDVRHAGVALLPIGLKGWSALRRLGGWQPVYRDALAEVWVRDASRFHTLAGRDLPVIGRPEATAGRAPFPREPPDRAAPPRAGSISQSGSRTRSAWRGCCGSCREPTRWSSPSPVSPPRA